MMTLRQYAQGLASVPAATAWHIADLSEAIGRQQLYTRQSPQKLKALREHSLIESSVSSNRIEGVTIETARRATVVMGRPTLKDRDEEEIAGYRDALNLIHSVPPRLAITEENIIRLHAMARGEIWDAGKYKEKDGDIIEKYPDGKVRVRFRPVRAGAMTRDAMTELVNLWNDCTRGKWVHPLVALAAFNLDFLCVHPFRDGNGRVSRLLLLLMSYHAGAEVGRYISLERLIEQNKERYYETLEISSAGWHEGKHDPWPYINFLLYTLKLAYREFEERVGQTPEPKGAKAQLVRDAVLKMVGEFRAVDIEVACPGVGRDWIRTVLAQMKAAGEVTSHGRGPGARWSVTEE